MQKTQRTFLFLGTGAADWIEPTLSGEFRRHSCMLVNGSMLIDCPACAIDALHKSAIPLSDIEWLLITHSHRDHLDISAIQTIDRERRGQGKAPLCIYAHPAIAHLLRENGLWATGLAFGLSVHLGNLIVAPVPANHTPGLVGEQALHYLVRDELGAFLYATDGAWLPYSAWDMIRDCTLDALVVDATIGDGHEGDYRIFEHNSLPMLRIMVDTLIRQKVLKEDSAVILTHMARTLHPDHSALVQSLKPPFLAAHDGMEITFPYRNPPK